MLASNSPLSATFGPIQWTGDLLDDCLARWAGLLLRAEWMNENYWWWAVCDMRLADEPQIDSSNEYEDRRWTSGEDARAEAEAVARRYLRAADNPSD